MSNPKPYSNMPLGPIVNCLDPNDNRQIDIQVKRERIPVVSDLPFKGFQYFEQAMIEAYLSDKVTVIVQNKISNQFHIFECDLGRGDALRKLRCNSYSTLWVSNFEWIHLFNLNLLETQRINDTEWAVQLTKLQANSNFNPTRLFERTFKVTLYDMPPNVRTNSYYAANYHFYGSENAKGVTYFIDPSGNRYRRKGASDYSVNNIQKNEDPPFSTCYILSRKAFLIESPLYTVRTMIHERVHGDDGKNYIWTLEEWKKSAYPNYTDWLRMQYKTNKLDPDSFYNAQIFLNGLMYYTDSENSITEVYASIISFISTYHYLPQNGKDENRFHPLDYAANRWEDHNTYRVGREERKAMEIFNKGIFEILSDYYKKLNKIGNNNVYMTSWKVYIEKSLSSCSGRKCTFFQYIKQIGK